MRPPIRRRLIVIILSICAQDGATSPLASPAGNAMRSKGASTAVLVIGQTGNGPVEPPQDRLPCAPPDANVQFVTLMANKMPYIGRRRAGVKRGNEALYRK